MKDFVLLYINGKRVELSSASALLMLSDFLRDERGLKGTKVVCAEGDCGACTVLVANMAHAKNGKLIYHPVNSCISLVANLNSCHVITVEGLKDFDGSLNPVQDSYVSGQGSQCGFCTPGFICATTSMIDNRLKQDKQITKQAVKNSLTGNLCRCTGYESIIDSTLAVDVKGWKDLDSKYNMQDIILELQSHFNAGLDFTGEGFHFYAPNSIESALELKGLQSSLNLIAGASDLGVQINKRGTDRTNFMTLSHIKELYEIQNHDDHIIVGANANLEDIEKALRDEFSEFTKMIHIFASPQIKNRATLIGNIVNASPVGDSIPFLMSMDALILISNSEGRREININDFYKGYKSFDLKDDEIVTGVKIPKLASNEFIKLFKVSLRKDMDISAVTFAAVTKISNSKIESIKISYGGVGPIVLRMPDVEKAIKGKVFEKDTFNNLDSLIEAGMTPMSDVRGSDKFRYTVSKNLMQKFYFESIDEVKKL